MSKSLVYTFPGRFGDLLWALPTVRAIADAAGRPVSLGISPKYASICDLIAAQPYIEACGIIADWVVQETAPITPWLAPLGEVHLGYRDWPDRPLPEYIYGQVREHYAKISMAPLSLSRPWITLPKRETYRPQIVYGWTDEWFELKYGITQLLSEPSRLSTWNASAFAGNRWEREAGWNPMSWEDVAMVLSGCRLFLGDCSALHVLAVAVGTPVILMEPNPQRHHPIFYPLGTVGPQVTLVCGNDGRPTFDARHVQDAIVTKLQELETR